MAVTAWMVLSIVLGILIGIVAPDVSPGDEEATTVLLGWGVLALGIVVGMRFSRLSGWRAWLLVIGGSVMGMFVASVVRGWLGLGVMFGFLGVTIWLVRGQRKRD